MKYDDELDATGLLCPLPVLKIRKRLKSLETNQIVKVIADDPAAKPSKPSVKFAPLEIDVTTKITKGIKTSQ